MYSEALAFYGTKRKAAKALNLSESTFRGRLKKELQNDIEQDFENPERSIWEEKGTEAIAEAHVKTLDDLIESCSIDQETWNIERWVANKWDMTNKYGTRYQNWQVKAFLKKKLDLDLVTFKKELLEDIAKNSPKVKATPRKKGRSLLELNTFDLHLGKLAWAEETGEDYDWKIAKQRFSEAFDTLLERAQSHDIEEILIPIGNDFFNSDNSYPTTTTTNGTYQHDDDRWQKIFRNGWRLYKEKIDQCKEVAPVRLISIPGNHDYQKTFYLGEVLWAMYANDKNVIVDNSPKARKYMLYGNTLLGFTHGNSKNESEKRLAQLMQQEARQEWAQAKFAEWHMGDIHHTKTVRYVSAEDHGGLVLRYLRSMASTDAWHYRKGFVGAQKGAEAFVFDKEYGMIANYFYNI